MRDRLALLVDIGSTYTKAVLVDLSTIEILAEGKNVTTVKEGVHIGLRQALAAIGVSREDLPGFTQRLACSSAAGGLSLVAIGLVPELTSEAARRAALGAGAVVRQVFSYRLTPAEVAELEALQPDIILLAGGTDGGEEKTIVYNARMLAESKMRVPVVVAGNKSVGERVTDILSRRNIDARLTENVMPRLNTLNVEPAQRAIRRIFLERIVHAKGLNRSQEMLEAVAMPTPAAVLAGAQLLADGLMADDQEPGWGELMVIDIGGATTDVHSVAEGGPARANVIVRGLPEPRLKRTVEGDLGLQISAPSLLAALSETRVRRALGNSDSLNLQSLTRQFGREVGRLPRNEMEWSLKAALGQGAIELAMARHVGRLREMWTSRGPMFIQEGKDLSQVGTVIGTGGIFARHPEAPAMLLGAMSDEQVPLILTPRRPQCFLDRRYIFWAAGLLAEAEPSAGLKLIKHYLVPLSEASRTIW